MSKKEPFERWLVENVKIWSAFCVLANQMRESQGRYAKANPEPGARVERKWSARAVLHVLRWETALRDPSAAPFKINNNWSARMARRYNEIYNCHFFCTRGGDA